MKPVLLFITILFCFVSIYGQNCTQNYLDAVKLFEQGFLDEVPQKITGCLDKGFTKAEEADAYKLLIQTYLYDDNHQEAEKYMAKFLKKFPEYELTATDPDVFVYLYNQYNTKPILQLGIVVGGMHSYYRLKENFGADNSVLNKSEYSPSGMSIDGGISISKTIKNKVDMNLALLINIIQVIDDDSVFFLENVPAYSKTELDYRIPQISVPLYFSYDIHNINLNMLNINFIPYISLGTGASISFKPKVTPKAFPESGSWTEREGTEKDITNIVYPFRWYCMAGAGLKIPIPTGFFVIDLKYNYGMSNLIKKNELLTDFEFSEKYFVQPDIFAVDNFEFTVSYRKSFYNPKRKKIQ